MKDNALVTEHVEYDLGFVAYRVVMESKNSLPTLGHDFRVETPATGNSKTTFKLSFFG